MNKKIKLIMVIGLSIVQDKSIAEVDFNQAVQITAVEPEFTDKQTYIHIQFDKAPHWEVTPMLEDHKTFLQLNLKGIDPRFPGKFWDVNSKTISKVALFRSSVSDTAIRIFPQEDNLLKLSDVSIEHLGSRVIISARHPGDSEIIRSGLVIGPPHIKGHNDTAVKFKEIGERKDEYSSGDNSASETAQAAKDSDDTRYQENQASPPKDTNPTQVSQDAEKNGDDMRSILIKVAGFLAALIVFGFLITTKRKLSMMKSLEMGVEKMPNILNLSTLPLSQKQKISLIQVGAERFLIGVSPGEIRLLTEIAAGNQSKYNERTPISRFQTEVIEQDYKEAHLGKASSLPAETRIKNTEESAKRQTLDPLRPKVKTTAERIPRTNRVTEPNRRSEVASNESAKTQSKIRIEISDEGIKNLSPRNMNDDSEKKSQDKRDNVVDDVTKLIRQRISGLKKI